MRPHRAAARAAMAATGRATLPSQLSTLKAPCMALKKSTTTSKKVKIPVQLFLSEGDWTVDTDVTKEIVFASFSDVDFHWFEGTEPHHLMVPEVSRVAKNVQSLIWEFSKGL